MIQNETKSASVQHFIVFVLCSQLSAETLDYGAAAKHQQQLSEELLIC